MIYGIIGAMDSEIALLKSKMTDISTMTAAGLTFYAGDLFSKKVVVVKCGVGKVNAAACAQMLIDKYAVDALINVGVAGGVSPLLKVKDVVVGTALLQHDFDLRPFGYTKGYLGREYGGDPQSPTLFKADEQLVERAFAAAQKILSADACHKGIIASGDEFVAASATREMIADQFGAMASEMEGAAIAQVASQNAVPFLVLRTISDLADGSAPVSFETVVQFAADVAASIIIEMIKD